MFLNEFLSNFNNLGLKSLILWIKIITDTHIYTHIHTHLCEFVDNIYFQSKTQILQLFLNQGSIIFCLKADHYHMNQI